MTNGRLGIAGELGLWFLPDKLAGDRCSAARFSKLSNTFTGEASSPGVISGNTDDSPAGLSGWKCCLMV